MNTSIINSVVFKKLLTYKIEIKMTCVQLPSSIGSEMLGSTTLFSNLGCVVSNGPCLFVQSANTKELIFT